MLKIKKFAFSSILMQNIFCMENNLLSHYNESFIDEYLNNEYDYDISLKSRNESTKSIEIVKEINDIAKFDNNNFNIISNNNNNDVNNNRNNINNNDIILDIENHLMPRVIINNYNSNNIFFRKILYLLAFTAYGYIFFKYFDILNPFRNTKNYDPNINECIDLSHLCPYNDIINSLKYKFEVIKYKDYCFGENKNNPKFYKTKFEFNDNKNCVLSINKLQHDNKSILTTGDYFHNIKVIYNYNTDLSYAFAHLYGNTLDIYNIDMSYILKINGLFYKSAINNLLGYEHKNFYHIINFDNVFRESFFNHPLKLNWNVNINSFKDSFKDIEVKEIYINNTNTTRLTNIDGTFDSIDLKKVVFYSLNTQNVKKYNKVFHKAIEEVKINTSNNNKIIEELESYNMICNDSLCFKKNNTTDYIINYLSKNIITDSNNSFLHKYIYNPLKKIFLLFK